MSLRAALCCCTLLPALAAQDSEVPLALNLPTAQMLRDWQPAIRFTHRFTESARDHSKDLYGLDGGNYAGFGLDLGIKAVPGLNAQIYRTADNKTLVLALQEQILNQDHVRLSARVERFDETVKRITLPSGTLGISGVAVQVPVQALWGAFTVSLVPTWLSRTSTQDRRLATIGLGAGWSFLEGQSLLGEIYPRPSRLDSATYEQGYALGYRFATKGHRFTLLATNTPGTTTHQVLGGDYTGGPRSASRWSLGFNLVRMF
jgi:hypothetical protein